MRGACRKSRRREGASAERAPFKRQPQPADANGSPPRHGVRRLRLRRSARTRGSACPLPSPHEQHGGAGERQTEQGQRPGRKRRHDHSTARTRGRRHGRGRGDARREGRRWSWRHGRRRRGNRNTPASPRLGGGELRSGNSDRNTKAQERVLGSKLIPRRRPTLPRGLPRSTIGAEGLNFRVRNGNGCGPFAKITGKTQYSFSYQFSVVSTRFPRGTQ